MRIREHERAIRESWPETLEKKRLLEIVFLSLVPMHEDMPVIKTEKTKRKFSQNSFMIYFPSSCCTLRLYCSCILYMYCGWNLSSFEEAFTFYWLMLKQMFWFDTWEGPKLGTLAEALYNLSNEPIVLLWSQGIDVKEIMISMILRQEEALQGELIIINQSRRRLKSAES